MNFTEAATRLGLDVAKEIRNLKRRLRYQAADVRIFPALPKEVPAVEYEDGPSSPELTQAYVKAYCTANWIKE